MNVVVEDISPCRKRLKIEVPAKRVDEEYANVTRTYAQHARIPGFRAGKVPSKLVEKRFAKEIEDELKRSLVPQVFREAVKEKNLKVISQPQVEDLNFQRGISMSFSTIVDLAPEFSLPDYKSIKLEKKVGEEITEDKINETINRIATQFADYRPIEGRNAQDGDFVVVDYTATSEGKPLNEIAQSAPTLGENKNLWLWLQKDSFIPGFTDQMIGAAVGETRTVNVTFPADFGHEALRGKPATYQVTVKELKERVLPIIDDPFTQDHFKLSAADLREHIKKDLEAQRDSNLRSEQVRDLITKLKDMTKFDLPESAVNRETQRLLYDIVQENQARGISQDILEKQKDEIFNSATDSAKERVKLGFILSRIAEAEKLEVNAEEFNAELTQMSARYQMKVAQLVKQLQKNGGIYELEDQILNRKTIDFLLQSATKE